MPFHSGTGKTVKIGIKNRNRQLCLGTRGKPGTDHGQVSYRMVCLNEGCRHMYCDNGSDVHMRRCPACQGGAPGIPY